MKTTFVSTAAMASVQRQAILKAQGELATTQKEITTGRLADVGLALGSRTREAVSLRQEHARLETIVTTNKLAGSRLETSQLTLDHLRKTADEFLGALVAVGDGKTSAQTLQQTAAEGLKGLIGSLNASSGGQYLFGGINSDAKPLADYFAAPATAASKQAVDGAFAAAFGVAQGDPGAAAITASDMQSFLDGDFKALFDGPQWSATWSQASSENIQSRISSTEVVETSVNANEQAVKKLAMAYTMVADLGAGQLNDETFRVVAETATRMISEGIHEVTALQGRVGAAQGRIAQVNERMSMQIDFLGKDIGSLENVDPYEAATRVTTLMTQLETGYALTARIQRLSILNYL
jgi:flagellar hook-associated protein 3 FlgL